MFLQISVIQLNRTEYSPPWGRCRAAAEGFLSQNEKPPWGRCRAAAEFMLQTNRGWGEVKKTNFTSAIQNPLL